MPLTELTLADIREVMSMSSARDSIDMPEEHKFGGAVGPAWEEWSVITKKLTARIDSLSPAAKAELTALAWLGRGDSGNNFDQLVAHAKQSGLDDTGSYLAAKAPLHAYIRSGVKKLGIGI